MKDQEEIMRLLRAGQVIYYSAVTDGAIRLINFETHTHQLVDRDAFHDMRESNRITWVKNTIGYPVCHGRVDVYDVTEKKEMS